MISTPLSALSTDGWESLNPRQRCESEAFIQDQRRETGEDNEKTIA
ncbi:hypothetical protein VCRLGP7_10013 [Vibrio crassostreae]|nr:hypothetical protein VCRLGP7_10013 [Vibrio crassostreae]